MAKRGRQIDKNPQFLYAAITESGTNTFTTSAVALPIPRLGTTRMVIEVLKVFAKLETLPEMAAGDAVEYGIAFRALTAMPALDNPSAMVLFRQEAHLTTSGLIAFVYPFVQDMTDGDGNGVLVASDQMHPFVQSTSQSAVMTAAFRVLYRFKRITSEEYIGIVQSQS